MLLPTRTLTTMYDGPVSTWTGEGRTGPVISVLLLCPPRLSSPNIFVDKGVGRCRELDAVRESRHARSDWPQQT